MSGGFHNNWPCECAEFVYLQFVQNIFLLLINVAIYTYFMPDCCAFCFFLFAFHSAISIVLILNSLSLLANINGRNSNLDYHPDFCLFTFSSYPHMMSSCHLWAAAVSPESFASFSSTKHFQILKLPSPHFFNSTNPRLIIYYSQK